LTDIGKAAIARILVPFEHEPNLFSYSDNWLTYLYGFMNSKFEEFSKNQISFITYNYDRTIEHFLITALMNSHNKSETDAANVLKNIPIIHLHGRLGYLPWQCPTDARPYSQVIDHAALKTCVKNIKIIHEDVTDRDADFKRAQQVLHDAKRVFFLGFGYNATNVGRLDLSVITTTDVFGTAQGFVPNEINALNILCSKKIIFYPCDCLRI
jgi:hypothetical protein